jgi:hypothetical protein
MLAAPAWAHLVCLRQHVQALVLYAGCQLRRKQGLRSPQDAEHARQQRPLQHPEEGHRNGQVASHQAQQSLRHIASLGDFRRLRAHQQAIQLCA